ncbi:hypothetical protein [Actinoplanes sp. NPDC020271]|uniref:hypothetical protein n=1 Tax=Actinoplanes sp. NPDC020271 TaxID=3363896 RepID=UPI003792B99D
MILLHAYQQEILDKLRDPAGPRFGTIIAPPGSGIRRPLEILLREISGESLGLILVTRHDLAAQWADRLTAAGVKPVLVLTGASAALSLLERGSAPPNGVIVTTYAAARHRLNQRALMGIEFELVIHDHPLSAFADQAEEVNFRARRAVALMDHHEDAWAEWSTIFTVPTQSDAEIHSIPLVRFYYEETRHERRLRDAAVEALEQYSSRAGAALALASDSLPVLHSRLLTAAAHLSEKENLSEVVWSILDRMDNLAVSDSRLEALDQVLGRLIKAGKRCVVVAATVTDANYIAEHLRGAVQSPGSLISGSNSFEERKLTLEGLGRGEYLVATSVLLTADVRWPAKTTLILWPSPINKRLLTGLANLEPDMAVIELTAALDHNGLGESIS